MNDEKLEQLIVENQLNFLMNLEIVLSGFIHDLNNPIAVAAGQSSIMKTLCDMNKMTDEKALRGSEKILNSTRKMTDIIQQLRNFYRPSVINKSQISLTLALDTIYKLSTAKIFRHDLKVEINTFEKQVLVDVNPIELNLALWNLHYFFLDIVEAQKDSSSLAIDAEFNEDNAHITYKLNGAKLDPELGATQIMICKYLVKKMGGQFDCPTQNSIKISLPAVLYI